MLAIGNVLESIQGITRRIAGKPFVNNTGGGGGLQYGDMEDNETGAYAGMVDKQEKQHKWEECMQGRGFNVD